MLQGGTRSLRGGEQRACVGTKTLRGRKNKETTRACPGLRGQERCMRGTLGQGRRAARAPLGAGPSRGNVGSRRKWGSCPEAPPQRGWGLRLRLLSSALARPTQSPTSSRTQRPRARLSGAAGEHSRGGLTAVRCDLGEPPSRPQPRGCGPQLPGRGGTRCRRRSERLSRRRLPGRRRSLPTRSLCFIISKRGTPPARAGLRLRRAVSGPRELPPPSPSSGGRFPRPGGSVTGPCGCSWWGVWSQHPVG